MSASRQRSAPSTMITRQPDRERHRGERVGDAGGSGRVALQQLDARAAPLLTFDERAQPRTALRDGAVIVTVDEVRGLEVGHG